MARRCSIYRGRHSLVSARRCTIKCIAAPGRSHRPAKRCQLTFVMAESARLLACRRRWHADCMDPVLMPALARLLSLLCVMFALSGCAPMLGLVGANQG